MSKCYVVYTDYQEDTMILNNLQHNVFKRRRGHFICRSVL